MAIKIFMYHLQDEHYLRTKNNKKSIIKIKTTHFKSKIQNNVKCESDDYFKNILFSHLLNTNKVQSSCGGFYYAARKLSICFNDN